MPQPRQPRNGRSNNRGAPSSRSKRAAILETATELFGREGYEHSKWADVATAVGIGSTALYHYFESKLHCLYEIMAEALEAEVERFERITGEHEDFAEALVAVLRVGVRPLRARGPAQPPAGLRAGARRRAPHVRARGGGAAARARAHARPRVQVGRVPDPRDGAGRDPRGGSAPARARDPRALQQRLPLVPPARRARRSPRWPTSTSRAASPWPACRCSPPTAPARRRAARSARGRPARARPSAEPGRIRPQTATGSR